MQASQFQRGLVTARAACGVLIPLNLCLQRVLIHCVKCQIAKPNRTHATSRSNYKRRRRKRSCLSQWLRCKDSPQEQSWDVLKRPSSCQTMARLLQGSWLSKLPQTFLAPCCSLLHLAAPCCTLLLHSLSTLHLSEWQDMLCFFEHSRTLTRMTSHGESLHSFTCRRQEEQTFKEQQIQTFCFDFY